MIDLVTSFFAVVLFALNTPHSQTTQLEFLSDKKYQKIFFFAKMKKRERIRSERGHG